MAFRTQFTTRAGEHLFSAETFAVPEGALMYAEVILSAPERCHVLTADGRQVAAVHVDPDGPVAAVTA